MKADNPLTEAEQLTLLPESDFEAKSAKGRCTITRYIGASETVVIPDTINGEPVKKIGRDAFMDCESMTSVTIPNSVTEIGGGAFWGCENLKSIVIPYGVTGIGEEAFFCCENLTSVTIPQSVSWIGDCAFYFCGNLSKIDFPNCLVEIGESAFRSCPSLTSVTISDTVEEIGDGAFSVCKNLESILVDPDNTSFSDMDGILFDKDMTVLLQYPAGRAPNAYTVPDSVYCIGKHAFSGCEYLTSINIPIGVFVIDDGAFELCKSLVNISVDTDNMRFSDVDGVLFNKDKSVLIQYPAGKRQSTYTIPDGVLSIGDRAFMTCENLTSVTIPKSVIGIDESAFGGCENLATVNIYADKNNVIIDPNAFPEHTTITFISDNISE